MTAAAKKKYLLSSCSTCGARLPADPAKYVYSRFTGNRYCLRCCISPPRKKEAAR